MSEKQNRQLALKASIIIILLFVGGSLISGYLAFNRFIARDEGYYLYAAKLILQGKLPYQDFFFPQMPLMPYLYSAWFWFFGVSWISARILALVLTILCGIFVFVLTRKDFGNTEGCLAFGAYCLCVLVQAYFSIAHIYSISCLLLLASLAALRISKHPFASGLLFSFCAASRLPMAPLGVLIILELLGQFKKRRMQALGLFALGALIPCGLVAALASQDPHNFLYHNFYYHLGRSALSAADSAGNRWAVFSALAGLRHGHAMGALQVQFLLYSGLSWFAYRLIHDRSIDWNGLYALALFAIHFLPEPIYRQYFSSVLVLMIPGTVALCITILRTMQAKLPGSLRNSLPIATAIIIAAAYITPAVFDFRDYTITGRNVIGVGANNAASWKIEKITEISQEIESLTKDSTLPAYASWVGYLLEANVPALEGTENYFGERWVRKSRMSREMSKRLKLVSEAEVLEAFKEGKVSLSVIFVGKGRHTDLEKKFKGIAGPALRSMYGVKFFRPRVGSD